MDAVALVAGVLGIEYAKVLELLPRREELVIAGVGWEEGSWAGRGSIPRATPRRGTPSSRMSRWSWMTCGSETRFRGHPLHEHGVVSGMTVIIAPGRRPFGVLGAHTRQRRTFTGDDVNFPQRWQRIAAAIEREWAEEKQRFLADTGAPLSSSLDYRATLEAWPGSGGAHAGGLVRGGHSGTRLHRKARGGTPRPREGRSCHEVAGALPARSRIPRRGIRRAASGPSRVLSRGHG